MFYLIFAPHRFGNCLFFLLSSNYLYQFISMHDFATLLPSFPRTLDIKCTGLMSHFKFGFCFPNVRFIFQPVHSLNEQTFLKIGLNPLNFSIY